MAEIKGKKITKVRLKVNIHLGGGRYAGKGSVISGSEGWLIDLVHAKQADPVDASVPDKIMDLEHVKALTFSDGLTGKDLTEKQLADMVQAVKNSNPKIMAELKAQVKAELKAEFDKQLEEAIGALKAEQQAEQPKEGDGKKKD